MRLEDRIDFTYSSGSIFFAASHATPWSHPFNALLLIVIFLCHREGRSILPSHNAYKDKYCPCNARASLWHDEYQNSVGSYDPVHPLVYRRGYTLWRQRISRRLPVRSVCGLKRPRRSNCVHHSRSAPSFLVSNGENQMDYHAGHRVVWDVHCADDVVPLNAGLDIINQPFPEKGGPLSQPGSLSLLGDSQPIPM